MADSEELDVNFPCMLCERETNGFPIHCSFCDEELKEAGAVLISPPLKGSTRAYIRTIKMHMCVKCYDGLTIKDAKVL